MAAGSIDIPMISEPSFIQVLVLIVILGSVFFFFFKKSNLPPGPWTLIPYIGFAPKIAYALYKGEPLYKFLAKLGQKHGHVFSFTALGIPFVVLNDYQAMREALQDTKLNDRGENKTLIRIFGKSCSKWENMGPYRSFALTCFRQFGIGASRFEESISKESTYLIQELANLKGQAVDLTRYFNNAVSNIISKVVFGIRFEFSDERIHRLTDLLVRHHELLGSGGVEILLPINIPSKAKQDLIKNDDEIIWPDKSSFFS
ncbi:cytochrome P450 2A9-like [Amphiura filiformis]|uniref:cytochrome P450 2A9-like n=1 Tax=Amphiura filiformis TaxID=82378 RepID=UPI003B20C911